MWQRLSWFVVLFILGSFLANMTEAAAKADWEEKWANTLARAKKEGSVSLYSMWGPQTRIALTKAFKDKYGINVEITPFSRGADLMAKVQTEQKAGIYAADVFGGGSGTLIAMMKPQALLRPIAPLLILPEVLDQKAWPGGKMPFADREAMAAYLIGTVIRTVIYNTDFVKEGEITSYRDLLKPQYKGKIALNDPSVTGAGFSAMVHLGQNLWGEADTLDFLRRLIQEQGASIHRDNNAHVDSVARGKYAIGLGPAPELLDKFMDAHAPLRIAMVKEDNRVTQAAGGFSVPTKFAHPNAAAVIVNWLLTKEGQSIFAKSFGGPPKRLDASVEGINPLFLPARGEKYYEETEEYIKARGKWLKIFKKFIAENAKQG